MLGQHVLDAPPNGLAVLPRLVFDEVGLPGKRHPKVPVVRVVFDELGQYGFQLVKLGGEGLERGHGSSKGNGAGL